MSGRREANVVGDVNGNTSKKKKDDESDHNEVEEEKDDDDSDDDDDEDPELGFTEAIYYMAAITLFISILSDVIVGTIEGAARSWNCPVAFISVVMLPIVGNAAEHASAAMFALRNKMDISIGVAIIEHPAYLPTPRFNTNDGQTTHPQIANGGAH